MTEPFLPMKHLTEPGVWMFWVGVLLAVGFALDARTGALDFALIGTQVGFVLMGAGSIEEKVEGWSNPVSLATVVGFIILAVSAFQVAMLCF